MADCSITKPCLRKWPKPSLLGIHLEEYLRPKEAVLPLSLAFTLRSTSYLEEQYSLSPWHLPWGVPQTWGSSTPSLLGIYLEEYLIPGGAVLPLSLAFTLRSTSDLGEQYSLSPWHLPWGGPQAWRSSTPSLLGIYLEEDLRPGGAVLPLSLAFTLRSTSDLGEQYSLSPWHLPWGGPQTWGSSTPSLLGIYLEEDLRPGGAVLPLSLAFTLRSTSDLGEQYSLSPWHLPWGVPQTWGSSTPSLLGIYLEQYLRPGGAVLPLSLAFTLRSTSDLEEQYSLSPWHLPWGVPQTWGSSTPSLLGIYLEEDLRPGGAVLPLSLAFTLSSTSDLWGVVPWEDAKQSLILCCQEPEI